MQLAKPEYDHILYLEVTEHAWMMLEKDRSYNLDRTNKDIGKNMGRIGCGRQ
jgi:hypothetical protein